MTAFHIVKKDQIFLDWLQQYPSGYVLNTELKPNPNYMMLHTADCDAWSKSYASENPFTGEKYSKVVAESISELREWMKKNGRPDGDFKGRQNSKGTGCRCLRTQANLAL